MRRQRVLGIDTGGTMVKAAVFAPDGAELGSARQGNQVEFPLPGHTKVDADEVWRSVCAAIQEAMAASGTAAGEIVGISATGHGNGLYAVDRAGQPILPGIISTDCRAAAVGAEWYEPDTAALRGRPSCSGSGPARHCTRGCPALHTRPGPRGGLPRQVRAVRGDGGGSRIDRKRPDPGDGQTGDRQS